MKKRHILLLASIRSLLRREMTVRGIAERFGVTEAQVLRWKDVFEIAGTVALAEFLSGQGNDERRTGKRRRKRDVGGGSEPTTIPTWSEPTTTPYPHESRRT